MLWKNIKWRIGRHGQHFLDKCIMTLLRIISHKQQTHTVLKLKTFHKELHLLFYVSIRVYMHLVIVAET